MTETRSDPASAASDPGRVADAVDRNWVDRLAPPRARPWLRLSRADRPIGVWLLLLPCFWGLSLAVASDPGGWTLADLHVALVCIVGAYLMRGAGCTWNDITDRDLDGGVARTRSRPIPSGQVSVKGALIWMAVQSLLAFGLLLTLPPAAILLGVVALGPVAIYPFMKRVTWWPQIFLGIAFNWGVLLTWAAHTGGLSAAPILLYLAGMAWTLFYDTIYACQDKEDDALMGIKSTARLFGEATRRWLLGFLVAAVLLALAAVALALGDSGPLALALGVAGVGAFGWCLHRQLARFDPDDTAACLTLFRDNRVAGLLLAGFLAAAGLV
ncbi:MAG: 4-hydroxybenzoate octaprenyltransferase [Paracoccaceae bacterium]